MKICDANLQFSRIPVNRIVTTLIVLHHAAANGNVESIHRYHRDTLGWAGIAYHFYIRKDGNIWRGRDLDWVGGHSGQPYDNYSVGICCEGNFDEETMSETQRNSVIECVKYCLNKYPKASIVRHSDIKPTNCPGKNYPFDIIVKESIKVAKPSEWAKEACEWAFNNGLIRGSVEDGTIESVAWQKQVTLEEIAVALYRASKKA